MVELLVKIEVNNRNLLNPTAKELERIRKDILLEKIKVAIPKESKKNEPLIYLRCKKILAEAVTQNIITTNDARYRAALKDMGNCIPQKIPSPSVLVLPTLPVDALSASTQELPPASG
ncbi:MAG TPA: hypothetical protein VN457_02380, partial [Chlamydiales bacterium]|nr:hypothetical protein [Chlamydiales bacterium]